MTELLLTYAPLDVQRAHEQLNTPECGGEVLFVGTVRTPNKGVEVLALEYEAYEPMVKVEFEKLAAEIQEKWNVMRVVLHHRLGRVLPGEAAVITGIAGRHRAEAFEASTYFMDELKKRIPIWKKEFLESGEVWV